MFWKAKLPMLCPVNTIKRRIMTSIEQLKQELLTQKSTIETKGGVVTTAYTNPSPAEITAGINTIPTIDHSLANATEGDVVSGKTFYSINSTLKTGTLTAYSAQELKILFNNSTTPADATKMDYYVPQGTKKLRDYFMSHTQSTLDVYLNSDLEEIGVSAFEECPNLRLKNFHDMEHLTKLGDYSLSGMNDIDLTDIPACIKTLSPYCFAETLKNNQSIVIPSTVESFGKGCFAVKSVMHRIICNNIDFSNFSLTTLPDSMIMGLVCKCNFTTPSTINTMPQSFNSYGCFKNITITSNITTLKNNCFGFITSNEPAEYNILETITFESETPPTCGLSCFGSTAFMSTKKIYVPDQSLSAYKAITNFKNYKNVIYPVSQKP